MFVHLSNEEAQEFIERAKADLQQDLVHITFHMVTAVMKLQLVLLAVASLALTKEGSAIPLNGLLPYQANSSLLTQSTLDEIEDLVKQEVLSSLYRAYLGLSPDYPASSCKQLAQLRPDYKSGYYWVAGDAGPTGVYCEMAGMDKFGENGGWMRIGHVDMTDGRTECPRGLEYAEIEGKGLCQKPRNQTPGCSSTAFGVQGIRYSKVCGKVIGYQYYDPNGFGPARYSNTISGTYIDGVSITHGSPKQHIWSLVAATDEVYHLGGDHSGCPCIDYNTTFTGTIPSFVGNDYYCETGNHGSREKKFFFEDPLWDGQGCEGTNHCCERGGPWFCTELDEPASDDVEIRICANEVNTNEDIVLQDIELYIQ